MSISRTYQGRVNGAYLVDGKKHLRTLELSNGAWQELLADHLRIYQNAINYYLVCFAACAKGSKRESLKNLETRVREAWDSHEFRKAGTKKGGFRASLSQSFPQHFSRKTTFDEAAKILTNPEVSPEALHLAIEALLHDLGGESSIQQGGRSYLPYFCSPKTKANFPRSTQLLERDTAKSELASVLHSEDTDVHEIRKNYQLHHFATLMKGQKPFTGGELKENLSEWLQHLTAEQFVSPKQQKVWEKEIQALPGEEISLPRYNGASAKGAEKNRLYAFLLFKLLPPSAERFAVLKSTFPEPKAPKKESKPKAKQLAEKARETRLTSLGDDPIELARGQRGHVFPSFSNFFSNADPADGPTWKEFDISAFKEALKTLNQIEQKTEERLDQLDSLKSNIDFFDKKTGPSADPEDPVTFHQDPRIPLISKLKDRLVEHLDDEFKEEGYTLKRATIKGWPAIRERYQKALARDPEISSEKLIENGVAAVRAKTKNVGSGILFNILAEAEFRPIWQKIAAEDIQKWADNIWSYDLLSDVVKYDRLVENHEDLKNNLHIKLTPAHLQFSRRPLMLSDLVGASKVVHLQRGGENSEPSLVCSVYKKNAEDIFAETRLELAYNAPRLQRDNLRGGENRSLHQPLLQGLGFPLPDPEKIAPKAKNLAVALMPDWISGNVAQRSAMPDRFLLNFPASLETDWIAEKIGSKNRWFGQFNGINDDPLHLHWPESYNNKKIPIWCEREDIQKNGFTLMANDLGIRAAASFAVYHVVSSREQVPENKRLFARPIGEAAGFSWHAYPLQRGTLRLPGEDQKVLRPISQQDRGVKRLRELYGEKGRLADTPETEKFRMELPDFVPFLLGGLKEEIENIITEKITIRYVREQNRLLLQVARQIQAHLRNTHRLIQELRTGKIHSEDEKKQMPGIHRETLNNHGAEASQVLCTRVSETRKKLESLLEFAANRIAPLKKKIWKIETQAARKLTDSKGIEQDFTPHQLIPEKRAWSEEKPPKIRGQGGLSLRRIEMLENLRKRLLSFQREINRDIGEEAKIGYGRQSGSLPEPAPELLQKLDHLKDQRVKQSAHLILARALNLQLKDEKTPKSERPDFLHGEFEKRAPLPTGRSTVDFIVIENLSRYRTEQGKSKAENRQLMQWSHRAITETLRELSQVYGLSVLAVPASFSSKFCALSGRPGFRAREVSQQNDYALKTWRETKTNPRKVSLAKQIDTLFEKYPDKKLKFLLPWDGGIMFVPAIGKKENRAEFAINQADFNAAQNLALRAVASPFQPDLLHKIRAQKKKGQLTLQARRDNIREKSAFAASSEISPAAANKPFAPETLEKKYTNFFTLGCPGRELPDAFDQAHLETTKGQSLKLASNYGLWSKVKNQLALENIVTINNQRLKKLGIPENDQLGVNLAPQANDPAKVQEDDDSDGIPMDF